MSDKSDAVRLPLSALAGGSGFAEDRRFVAGAAARPAEPAEPAVDPVEAAFAEGYAQGHEEARAAAQAEAALADAGRARIETALARFDGAALHQFEERLQATVLALCEAAVAPAAIDPENLARRVAAAAAMFARAADSRVIRLHPEDLALVHARLPEDWHCEPDPTLERGGLRVETAAGGVEDGPAQWRAALEEALRAC